MESRMDPRLVCSVSTVVDSVHSETAATPQSHSESRSVALDEVELAWTWPAPHQRVTGR
jgi:hypothetical protein